MMENHRRLEKNLEKWAQFSPRQAIMLQSMQFSQKPHIYYDKEKAQRWFDQLSLERATVLCVFGLDDAALYETSQEWLLKKKSHSIIFLENDLNKIRTFFGTELGTSFLKNSRASLYFYDSNDTDLINKLSWNLINEEVAIVASPDKLEQEAETFNELESQLLQAITSKQALLHEYLHLGISFFRNFYPNLLGFPGAHSGQDFANQFKNVPAIICGAGPSLDKAIPLLKKIHDKALIISGGSTLCALSAAQLRPHFGVGIDPNAVQLDRIQRQSYKDLPFFYRFRMYHPAVKLLEGPRIYLRGSGGYDIAEWFEEQLQITGDVLDEGHNLINFAIEIARFLGCNPIILVGMDLSFTNLSSYAKGIVDNPKVKIEQITRTANLDDQAVIRQDIFGKPIYTLWKWIAESEWTAEYAKEHANLKIINATGGGLGFEGIPNQALEEVVQLYCNRPLDIDHRIEEALKVQSLGHITKEEIQEKLRLFKESMERSVEHLDALVKEWQAGRDSSSALSALAESELSEEPAYQSLLSIFNEAYMRLQTKPFQDMQRSQSKANAKKRAKLNIERLEFLMKVLRFNMDLIDYSLKKY